MKKAVVFDMDGLMFDTEKVFIKAWDYAGEKTGIGKAGYMVIKTLGLNVNDSTSLYVLLDYLKANNYKLAVASSSPRWEVERHLKDAEVFDYFDAIVCGDMVTHSKPDPEIYLKACELLNVSPADSFALEDSQNGLLSAHRAGLKPIMVPDLWEPDEATLKILHGKFEDLEQVKEYLENI